MGTILLIHLPGYRWEIHVRRWYCRGSCFLQYDLLKGEPFRINTCGVVKGSDLSKSFWRKQDLLQYHLRTWILHHILADVLAK